MPGIPQSFLIPWNVEITTWIARRPDQSAHDDVASALADAARGLRDVRSFCPNPRAYAWVALHLGNGRIFALACGQSALLFRLPAERAAEAAAAGGVAQPEIGAGWFEFRAWDLGPAAAAAWCKLAHDAAAAAN